MPERSFGPRNLSGTSLSGPPQQAQTFRRIESVTGDLTLMSLKTNRYLRVNFDSGKLSADSPGPEPNGPPGVRFNWH